MEEWKTVLGYEGFYEVSNMGKVRSVDRLSVNSLGYHRNLKGKVLKLYCRSKKDPHLMVELNADSNTENKHVHTLVLEAFVGKRPEGLVCRHLDGNPKNNKLTNLKWGTYSENLYDAYKHGRTTNQGSKHGMSKVTEEDVLEIRRLHSEGMKQKDICELFPVNKARICEIVNRKTWKHI